MPLLQGRSGRPRGQASSSAAGPSRQRGQEGGALDLPPYQPPSFPLNDAGRRALAQISHNRITRQLEKHLAKSTELIRDVVGATNDRAAEVHARAKESEARRRERETEETDAEREIAQYAEQFIDKVARTTAELEAALRQNIDYRIELEDEATVMQVVQDQALVEARTWKPKPVRARKRKAKRRRPDADPEDDDAEEEEEEEEEEDQDEPDSNPPLQGVNNVLEGARQARAQEWQGMDMVGRYANHNDYKLFKRTMHEAQHPDGDVQLPHASAWFDEDGKPVLPKVGEVVAGNDDEDEELQIVGGKLDTKCPLSLTEMTEPFTSSRCKHSFQKDAIVDYMRTWRPNGQSVRCICPVVGCDQEIKREDFYLDKMLLKRLDKQRAADQADDDMEDVDEDEDDDVDREVRMKSERAVVKSERRRREEEEDGE